MTKKNTFAKRLGEFLLGLVKVCVFMAAMTGTVVASAFFFVQGTFVVLNKYGFRGITIELGIMFVALAFACFVFQEKRDQNNAQRTRSKAATEKLEPRWRRNAPATLTDVPLEEWAIGALTILRQIELAFDSEQFCGDIACGPILHAVRPGQHTTCIFVDEANPVALHAFVRNGGDAFQQEATTGNPGKPTRVPLPFYLVIFPTAKTDDALADLARSIRSEAQAEIDRRALENKKETHRD